MIVFIDGDSLVYRAAGIVQKKDKETGEISVEPVENALSVVKNSLLNILEKTGALDYRLFLTASNDETSFRKLRYPMYKENRSRYTRPIHYHAVREYLIETWLAEVVSGIEADDAVSIEYLAYIVEKFGPACIAGIDKDLLNTPALHFNFNTNEFKLQGEDDALKHFWMQVILGDPSDNIPRINKGWGKRKEEKIVKQKLENETNIDPIIELIYNEFSRFYENPTEEIQKRGELLWIMRKPNDYWRFEYERK